MVNLLVMIEVEKFPNVLLVILEAVLMKQAIVVMQRLSKKFVTMITFVLQKTPKLMNLLLRSACHKKDQLYL